MSTPKEVSRRWPIYTMRLGFIATGTGLLAVLSHGQEWVLVPVVLFIGLSIATASGVLVSAPDLWKGRLDRYSLAIMAYGLVPLLCLWGFALWPHPRYVGNNRRALANGSARGVGMAIHTHHDAHHGKLPSDIRDAKNVPLLSWRVAISPYMDGKFTYEKFDLKQPWNSAQNLPLVDEVPSGIRGYDSPPGQTPWQGFVGKGTAFEPGPPLTLTADFPDGLENTILAVESPQMVPWSKPADIAYAPNLPLPNLTQKYHRPAPWPQNGWVASPGFHAVMADGSVRFISPDISDATLRAMIVRNDGQP